MSCKKIKCRLHYHDIDRGVIIYDDVTYSGLVNMVMSKFNLNHNDRVNLKVKLPSIDSLLDITDDNEVIFMVECALQSPSEIVELFVSQTKNFEATKSFNTTQQVPHFHNFFSSTIDEHIGSASDVPFMYAEKDDFQNNDSGYKHEANFTKTDSSFAFNSNNEQEDDFLNNYYAYKNEANFTKPGSSSAFSSYNEQENDFLSIDSGYKNEANFTKPGSSCALSSDTEQEDEPSNTYLDLNNQPQPIHQNWTNCFKHIPQVPETPLYKSKPFSTEVYDKENRIKVNELFLDRATLDMEYRLKSLEDGFEFVSKKSNPSTHSVKCVQHGKCAWFVNAKRWKNSDVFQITKMNDVHTCDRTQTFPNHRNANKKVIAHIMKGKLQDGSRDLKPRDIQKDILAQYKTSISYKQAWRGKDYGLKKLRGSPLESFEMLPYYCYNLEKKNPGTVTRIKTNNAGVFEILFIAIGASVSLVIFLIFYCNTFF